MSPEGYVLFQIQTRNNPCLPIDKWVKKNLKKRDDRGVGVGLCFCLSVCLSVCVIECYSIPFHNRILFGLERGGKLITWTTRINLKDINTKENSLEDNRLKIHIQISNLKT